MKRGVARAVVMATMLTVVLPACAGASHRGGEACRVDAECTSGFCDAAVCAQPEGVYGAACKAAPRTREGFRDARVETCGAYLCIDERCRSCSSDAECLAELGAPQCQASDTHPGMRCGR